MTLGGGVTDEAFAEVFRAHAPGALGVAYLLCGDRTRAEDAVSEAFARVYAQWRRGHVDDLGAYLHRAVVNQARNGWRSRMREGRALQRHAHHPPGRGEGIEETVERDRFRRVLLRLPERQRAAVVLRYYADLSEADTAAVLGCAVGTVKSQVSRGLSRLRELLNDDAAVRGDNR